MIESSEGEGRCVVRHVRPLSAARMGFGLALCLAGIILVGLFALWLLALASGALRPVETFLGILAGAPRLRVNFFALLPVFLLLTLIGSGLAAVFGIVGAMVYNALSDVIGGLEVSVRKR